MRTPHTRSAGTADQLKERKKKGTDRTVPRHTGETVDGIMNQKDLTKGSVFPTMCLFALPMILGNILQQGYNVVDTWVVGRFAGSNALAAVGSAFALMTFLTSVLLGLCMGSGVVFSLCFGRQDEKGLENSICASFLMVADRKSVV